MKRRELLLLPLAVCLDAADPAQEVVDLVADAAGALSAGNVSLFLKAFDPAMAGYARLRENVTGLVSQGEVQSFIEPAEDEGDGRRRVAQFRWTLRLVRGQRATSSTQREQVVKCTLEKQGAKWRVVALEPVEFFAPAS